MISNDDYSTDGKSFHPVTGSKGLSRSIRVGSKRLPLYLVITVCLGLLNTILLLTAVVIGIYCGSVSNESSTQQMIPQTLIIEVKHLQRMQSEAIKSEEMAKQALETEVIIHQQLKLQLEQNKTISDAVQGQLETLQVERATLMAAASDMQESCGRCRSGWVLLNTSCYFHAKAASNPLKTWSDSRADCIGRGADLAVIDNLEEQVSLFENLPKLDRSVRPWWSRPVGVWIGITDIQTEGTWVWVNNVTLQDGGYWIQGEPNNHGAQGEDCGALINIDTPMRTWFDGNCQDAREWLCEMQPN
ncbi:CD209 antigen-like protein B [Mastacembelus armatus]|uniref:CD209 antigen-like protein B n=2 Tax=Mastacembelus armatus TaxID=205130 RepID=A0A3Q3L3P2_9TELE|nr:CD209 antigen-like protein B [Mastacembelus armatus]